MKRRMLLSLVLALGLSGAAWAAPMTYFDFDGDGLADPAVDILAVGNTFTAAIWVTNLDEVGDVTSLGVDVFFDPTQVQGLSFSLAGTWFLDFGSNIDNAAGLAQLGGGTLFGNTANTLLIGSLTFECVGGGVSLLEMAKYNSLLASFDGNVASTGAFDAITDFGSAQVNQVPIPGSLLLLGSGLAGVLGFRRRTKS